MLFVSSPASTWTTGSDAIIILVNNTKHYTYTQIHMYLEQRMKRDIALMPTTICCELQATPHTKDKNGVYNNCETTSFDSEIDLVT